MATVDIPGEQRVVLHNISWETYERLLNERGKRRYPRFTYDRGVLEIMSPVSLEHEESADNLRFLVRTLLEELGIDFRTAGSMSLKSREIEGGAEPDGCFYIQNEPGVRGQLRIDLSMDPPPDLAIEVDVTNPSLNKLLIYARFGLPEVWRHDGARLRIYVLRGDRYMESAESSVLPGVTADAMSELLEQSKLENARLWQRRVREWARRVAGS